jgi:dihydroorotase
VGALEHLANFVSRNGAKFYGLPVSEGPTITLVKRPWTVPDAYPFGTSEVVPLKAGQQIAWALEG